MKKTLFFQALLIFILLTVGCEEKTSEMAEVALKPGTPIYFYELGFAASDLEEKLAHYESGLKAVRHKKDSNLVALLEGKVYVLGRMGEFEAAVPWLDSLLVAAEFQKDSFYLAKAYSRKAWISRYIGSPEDVFQNSYLSGQIYLKMGDTSWGGRRSLDMAHAQLGMGDYSGSQETATEALEYLDRETDSIYVSSAYNVVGLSYANQGFHEDAVKEYHNALRYARGRKDSLSYLHNIALVYKDQKKYDKALAIFRQIIDSPEPDLSSQSRFLDNYAFTRWLKCPDERVDTLLLQALETRKEINDREGMLTSYSHLSEYYSKKDRETAENFARQYLNLSREYGAPVSEVMALKRLMPFVSGPEKDTYLDRYVNLNDSLKDAGLKAKYQFAKIRFDEERKQQQISILEAANYKQTLQTERLETRNLVSSFIAVVVFLSALLLFFYLRQRNKREKIREVYMAESRISKKIHDELANDVYNLMSSLEPLGSKETNDQLEKIYHQTRNISRENSEIETEKNFIEGLLLNLGHIAGDAKLILRGEKSVDWQKLEKEKKIVIYRVLQELLVNMRKHSNARFVAISFDLEKPMLKITYSDNGKGCDPEVLRTGNGLKNVRDRLRAVNGKVVFEAEAGKGLKAEISLKV